MLVGQNGAISKQFGNKIHVESFHIFNHIIIKRIMKQGKEKGLANAYYCCAIPNLVN